MPSAHIVKSVEIAQTPRVVQLEGLFDVPPSEKSQEEWDVDLPCDEKEWSIGLIVGPSGSGKTTIAQKLFKKEIIEGYSWSKTESIVDGFPKGMSIRDITGYLSSVGFSSPPNWLRPYHVLSTGEQFRVTMARALAESPNLAVMDEFTSVVDRKVAQIGSAAIAKTVRKKGQKFIGIACHYDIIEWLQPDWIYDLRSNAFSWRSVQRHPKLTFEIHRVHYSAWKLFSKYHYLNHEINRAAKCFIAFSDGEPVAFCAWSHCVSAGGGYWRGHRVVCLPDYQGIGLGVKFSDYVAGLMAAIKHKRVFVTTAHPGMIYYHAASPLWSLYRKVNRASETGSMHQKKELQRNWAMNSERRATASFVFKGKPNYADAQKFGLI